MGRSKRARPMGLTILRNEHYIAETEHGAIVAMHCVLCGKFSATRDGAGDSRSYFDLRDKIVKHIRAKHPRGTP